MKKLTILAPLVLAGLIGVSNTAEASTIYTVQSGDTMYKISQKFSVSLSSLETANAQITNFNNIWIGETINIPSAIPTWQIKANAIINTGLKYLGVPYQYGASTGSTTSFDCSSFTQYIFGQNGITLPRVSRDQAQVGTYVAKSDIREGDLLFFTDADRVNLTGIDRIGHVGVYMGNGKMLEASTSKGVTTVDMTTAYWQNYYVTARRVIN